eukprot:CAMPEP_0170178408 /NCGR_PEP_ID=MMETSP0040_2-20121228/11864_1 /TAXON_ID=641309 /ORGANISM="Lotharella oceanica, Strain CCMP622" /LENGTH=340 /DNA_ID=CAMNT_0010421455 /DNA_START=28 /DNA_END=1050 /DNA_ORIENTATION=-
MTRPFLVLAAVASGLWQDGGKTLESSNGTLSKLAKESPILSTGLVRTEYEPLPREILDAAGAVIDGKLYACGGKHSEDEHLQSLFVYDPETNHWTQLADRPGPAVENTAVAALDGKFYAVAGSTLPFSGSISDAHVYDPATNTWETLPPIKVKRGGVTGQAVEGKIYVIGGMDDDGKSLDTVEAYDPKTNEWSMVAPLQERRDNPGSAVLNGELYVFGGRTTNAGVREIIDPCLRTVEKYDVKTNSWSFVAPMPTGRRTMVVGTLNGKAQVMGGEKKPDGSAFDENEEYDPKTDSWRSLTPMHVGRHGAAGGTIGDRVYLAGGGPVGGAFFMSEMESFEY